MRTLLFLSCIGSLFFSGRLEVSPKQLKTGDILFRQRSTEQLSQAIDRVTQTEKGTHFSHIGMVERNNNDLFILHADPEGGCCKVPLSKFLQPDSIPRRVVAYRLKEYVRSGIPLAIQRAHDMLGKPYNWTYIRNDTSYYCSEFIYKAFEMDSVFQLQPMTFKDPETGHFLPSWISFYEKLGLDIPEGAPGCNPNGMAFSDNLEKLGEVILSSE